MGIWVRGFKELAHVIVEMHVQSHRVSQQAGDPGKSCSSSLGVEFFCPQGL